MSTETQSKSFFSLSINKIAFFALLFLLCVLGFGRMGIIFDAPQRVQPTGSEFHVSIMNGDYEQVNRFLVQGMDPNTRDDDHRTALYVAEVTGQDEIAKLLIERGAVRDVADASGLEKRIGTKLNDPMRAYLEALDKQKFARVDEITPQASAQ